MNGVKGYSVGPVKVSEMRQMIHSGKFANWIAGIRLAQEQIKAEILAARQHKKTLKLIRDIMEGNDEKAQA